MIKFLLRKSFFYAWDNMFRIFLSNLVVPVFTALMILLIRIEYLPVETVLYIAVAVSVLFFHVYAGAVSAAAAEAADFKSYSFRVMFDALRRSWIRGLGLGLISLMLLFLNIRVLIGILPSAGLGAYFFAGIIFWVNIIWLAVLQYAVPLLSGSGGTIIKSLYRSFLIVLDNPARSLFGLLFSVFLGILSVFTFFLMPGFAGILLFQRNLLRILMKKYDRPGEDLSGNRRKVPWKQIIEDDAETLGSRNIKSLLFPWRD